MANKFRPLFIGIELEHPIPHKIGTDSEGYVGRFRQHVTLCFKPTDEELKIYESLLGQKVMIKVTHYGGTNTHEGMLVSLDGSTPYLNHSKPHITISVANGGKAVDTPNAITFEKIDDFYLTGAIKEFY